MMWIIISTTIRDRELAKWARTQRAVGRRDESPGTLDKHHHGSQVGWLKLRICIVRGVYD